jgi:miniconductance mechanosensitive channel
MEKIEQFLLGLWSKIENQINEVLLFAGLAAGSYMLFKAFRYGLIKIAHRVALSSKNQFDDILIENRFFRRVALLLPLLIFNVTASWFPAVENLILKSTEAGTALLLFLVLISLLGAVNQYYGTLEMSEHRPIKGIIQTVQLILWILAAIIVISILSGYEAITLLSGLGALTAVIILIFKDTLLSFVASLQISSSDLVREGDWISVPAFEADGDVIDLSLHIVKVQNWDKTITIIPTYKLIDHTFKNWRGMQNSGGRRVKRAIYIDVQSIGFCTSEMLAKLKEVGILRTYLEEKEAELIAANDNWRELADIPLNRRQLTNIGVFRVYLQNFLRNHDKVRQDMTLLVRQLQPTENGVPLELYFFVNDVRWVNYEGVQSDIFDHILSTIHLFELVIFQNPSGKDFRQLPGSLSS